MGAGGTQTLVGLEMLDDVGVGVSEIVGGAVVVSGGFLSAQSTL